MEQLDYDYLAKLVKRTQKGDSDAFAELYAATYQNQYHFAYKYVNDPYLAQDILQDMYIIVLKNIHTLKRPKSFVSWLHQICFRLCFDAAKKKIKESEELNYDDISQVDALTASTDSVSDPEQQTIAKDEQVNIMGAVLSLPPQYAQVVIMRYYNNMAIDDISEAMDCSRSTTKRRIKKAQELLAGILGDEKGGIHFD